jgi:uncharacterized membrane protein
MIKYYLIASLIAIFASIGQIFLKLGVASNISKIVTFNDLVIFLFRPYLLAGFSIYFLCAFLWLWVLTKIQLNIAYPFLSLTFVFVPLFSWIFIGEKLTLTYLTGTSLIFIGAYIIIYGAK